MENNAPPLLKNHLRRRLARSSLFTGLDEEVLDEMVANGRQENWPKGFEAPPDTFIERFFVVTQGRLEAVRTDPVTRKPFTLFVLGPGDGYDIVPLLDGEPHNTGAIALDDMLLLSFPIEQIREWLHEYPQMNRNFLPYAATCLRHMENLATDLALHDTLTRLARLILRHVDQSHPPDARPYPVHLIHDLKHERLARMIGSVRQVVNQHLQKLKKSGALEHRAEGLFVRDLERLIHYAEGLQHKGNRP